MKATRRAPIASVLNFHEFGTDEVLERAAFKPQPLPQIHDTEPCPPPDGCLDLVGSVYERVMGR